ncbi:MAG: mono/diheme cytochrome c family protein [Bacteriovoracaceae bacterium]|jgi:hypothetical protein
MSVTLKLMMAVTISGVVGILSLHSLILFENEILIESLESNTSDGKKVFNKIKLKVFPEKDIWFMSQNHNELKGDWDQLKITVDKRVKPYKAYFSQLKNGKEVEYRVSCYKCHANGPRAIRANLKSKIVDHSFLDRAQVIAWNFKIKHYGTVETPQNIRLGAKYRKVPLKYEGRVDNKVVNLKTCSLCHSEQSFLGRKNLVLQQKTTILHLVRSGEMPPWPFKLSKEDKIELEKQLFL